MHEKTYYVYIYTPRETLAARRLLSMLRRQGHHVRAPARHHQRRQRRTQLEGDRGRNHLRIPIKRSRQVQHPVRWLLLACHLVPDVRLRPACTRCLHLRLHGWDSMGFDQRNRCLSQRSPQDMLRVHNRRQHEDQHPQCVRRACMPETQLACRRHRRWRCAVARHRRLADKGPHMRLLPGYCSLQFFELNHPPSARVATLGFQAGASGTRRT